MIPGKKADLGLHWPEFLSLILLILGFAFQLTTIGSTLLSYIVIFFWGMLFGRLWHRMKSSFRFPLILLMAGFLAGYIAAALFTRYGRPIPLIILFIAGTIISHLLHSKEIFPETDF